MTAVALAGQSSLLWPDRIQLPRYPQVDNEDSLLFGVKAAEKYKKENIQRRLKINISTRLEEFITFASNSLTLFYP